MSKAKDNIANLFHGMASVAAENGFETVEEIQFVQDVAKVYHNHIEQHLDEKELTELEMVMDFFTKSTNMAMERIASETV